MDVTGIEYKALPSLSHLTERDTIFFSHLGFFGLACLKSIKIDSERGRRTVAVGILARDFVGLGQHIPFLEQQASFFASERGHYRDLELYINTRQLEQFDFLEQPTNALVPEIVSFSDFCLDFGPSLFALWKNIVLRKRILFLDPPPVFMLSVRVFYCMLMGGTTESNPLFFMNVHDIDRIQTLTSYIGCTTETIFQSKHQLYDVLVQGKTLSTHSPTIRTNVQDIARYKELRTFMLEKPKSLTGKMKRISLGWKPKYFARLNHTLYSNLQTIGQLKEPVLQKCCVNTLGLDPSSDIVFLKELIQLLKLEIGVLQMPGRKRRMSIQDGPAYRKPITTTCNICMILSKSDVLLS
ncbi:hypothetical protein EDD86DRAFT_256519 [Gorgonomyces haynaldii]|nr:hypothetical protein EDD86DRAFT_256519 [Gorgonomyces haynaldii]